MGEDTTLGVERFLRLISLALAPALFLAALWVLHHELAGVHLAEVIDRVRAMPPSALWLALLATAASYLALTGYDALALRHLGHSVRFPRIAMTSFIANAVGHNLGLAWLSGGAVRLRMYMTWGLSGMEVASVVAMVGLTFGMGMLACLAVVLLLAPDEVAAVTRLSQSVAEGAGVALLGLLAAYLLWGWRRSGPLQLGPWRVQVPHATTSLTQILIASVDLAFAGAALYVLLPPDSQVTFPVFLAAYVIALLAGILSHVPGGIGVFETALLLGLPQVPKDALLAAILLYRLVYYLLPLTLGAVLGAAHELRQYGVRLPRGLAVARDALEAVTPQAIAGLVFVAGAVLLVSGATPARPERMDVLREWLALPVLEMSHLAGSLVGLVLLVLASALYRRSQAAHRIALVLLVAAVPASLLKGLDWEEALLATVAALALWGASAAFHRRAPLLDQTLTAGWVMAVTVVVAGSLWLGLFAYKHLEYNHELWWQFAFDADAPRFLRASMLIAITAVGLGVQRLLHPAAPPPGTANAQELELAARLVGKSPRADAALALLGDKRLLFASEGDGFLMFQTQGRSWISMGDPVGSPEAVETLAWRFRELCDSYGGRCVFYQVDAQNLPLYLDLGLAPMKIGEEAVVDLHTFSLEGSARAGLRQAQRKIARAGLTFDVLAPTDLDDATMDALGLVSAEWLSAKATREKSFSLGRFDPSYLRHFPIAVARQEGRIVAFASLWSGVEGSELSVDLMRHLSSVPNGVMDFLFVEIMLWGKARGYASFNLGMAPLSGLETHRLAPLWHRVGAFLFRSGEHFYNFEGLRAYKQKYRPNWLPKYLAAPSSRDLPAALLDVASLVSGGLTGVVAR